jgi:hypothetical protein
MRFTNGFCPWETLFCTAMLKVSKKIEASQYSLGCAVCGGRQGQEGSCQEVETEAQQISRLGGGSGVRGESVIPLSSPPPGS